MRGAILHAGQTGDTGDARCLAVTMKGRRGGMVGGDLKVHVLQTHIVHQFM